MNQQDSFQRRDPGTTSMSLLERCVRHEEIAWKRLSQLYFPLVYSWCRRRGLQPTDASDVAQEVFHALAGSLNRFDGDPQHSFRGWLWGITRNKLLHFFRIQAQSPRARGGTTNLALPNTVDVREPIDAEPDDASDNQLLAQRALDLIRTEFEESTWNAFWLSAVDGCAADEISSKLGISRNAVYLAKSRVLKRLRVEFKDLIEF